MQIEFINKLQQPLCDGWNLGASLGGALIGAVGQAVTNQQNQKYQKELMGLQHGYNEKSAEAAYQRQRELNAENWRMYNSYEAQRKSMEAAGLSPALMYGTNGVGGSGAGNTAPQAQGVGLPQAALGNVGAAAIQGAQLGLLNAETKKTEAEANRINSLLPAEVADTWASVRNKEANTKYQLKQARLTQLLGDNQVIKNAFEGQHQLYEINRQFIENLNLTIKFQRDGLLLDFEQQTFDEKVKQFKEQTKRITAETLLLESQKELNEKNKELVQKELDNFETTLQNQIMQAMGTYNQGQAAKINATAAVVELNNNLKIQGVQLTQKNLELYIEASKASGAAQIGLNAGLGGNGGGGGKGLHAGINLGGSGSGNRARKDAKENYFAGNGYIPEFMPEIEIDWKALN